MSYYHKELAVDNLWHWGQCSSGMDFYQSLSNNESDEDENSPDISQPAEPVNETAGHNDMEPLGGDAEIDEKFYEVERILGHKNTKEGLFYLVRWKGYTKADDSWEPAKNLSLAMDAILHYKTSKKVFPKRRKGMRKGQRTPKSITHKGLGKKRITWKSASCKRAMTKALPESHPPTTLKSGSTSLPPSGALSSATKFTHAWLYESNSDEESEVEKKCEKCTKQRKLAAERRERVGEKDKLWQKKKEKSFERYRNITMGNKRKWQTETSKSYNRKKRKEAERDGIQDKIKREIPSEESVNGVTAIVANKDNVGKQIFAIGKTSDGRIKVLVDTDGTKKIVSLRDAHDLNPWGLLQHVLQYVVFQTLE